MKRLCVILLCLFSCWAMITACDDTSGPDTYTLSGDITAEFYSETPDNILTINLMTENDCAGTPVSIYFSNEWRATKAAPTYTSFSSYEISGIEAGTYYLCGSIDGTTVYGNDSYGPVEIEISEDTVKNINFNLP